MKSADVQPIAANLWVIEFPMKLLGTSIGRRTTLIRLGDGEMIVHSTAPFDPEDCKAIRLLGPVGYLLEATLFHDTFASAGSAAFPDARFFAPPGYERRVQLDRAIESLESPPASWAGDLALERVGGMPSVNEYAVLHRPSRTLIVADLVFNIGPDVDPWTAFFFRFIAGTFGRVRMSRMFRSMIRARPDFEQSMERILAWDFDRLIMGHGQIVESGGKQRLREAFEEQRGTR